MQFSIRISIVHLELFHYTIHQTPKLRLPTRNSPYAALKAFAFNTFLCVSWTQLNDIRRRTHSKRYCILRLHNRCSPSPLADDLYMLEAYNIDGTIADEIAILVVTTVTTISTYGRREYT